MYAVNADGGSDGIIFGFRMGSQGATHIARSTSRLAYAVLVDPLRDDPRHALIATYAWNGANLGRTRTASASGVFPDVERIDMFTGAITPVTVSPLRNVSFLTDHHGRVRFAYGTDTDQAAKVWYRAGDGAPWSLLLDEAREHRRMLPLAFNRNEGMSYFSCAGMHGVGGICRWDISTRKFSTLWSDTVAGVEELMLSFDDDDIVAVRSMPGRAATTLIDKKAPEAKRLVGLMQ